MQGVITYQRRDGRWVSRRATFSVRNFESETRGVADSSAEAHLAFLENESETAARQKKED